MFIANLSNSFEVSRHRRKATQSSSTDSLSHKCRNVLRSNTKILCLKLICQSLDIILVGFVSLQPINEAGVNKADIVREPVAVHGPLRFVATNTECSNRVSMIALFSCDDMVLLGHSSLVPVLCCELDSSNSGFAPRVDEYGLGQAAGLPL